jgi:hypothetical protein
VSLSAPKKLQKQLDSSFEFKDKLLLSFWSIMVVKLGSTICEKKVGFFFNANSEVSIEAALKNA